MGPQEDKITRPLRGGIILSSQHPIQILLIYSIQLVNTYLMYITSSLLLYISNLYSTKANFVTRKMEVMNRRSSSFSDGKIRMIQGAILALALTIFLGNLMMWIIMPTFTYYQKWVPVLVAATNSTFFDIQGILILIMYSIFPSSRREFRI